MRIWWKALGVAVLLALAACSPQKPADKAAAPAAGGTLRIYNWSDYIDPALLDQFTKETGIKTVYDTFDSNEVLETKVLQGNTGYDIVVPSNHNVPRYITAGAIQPLDKSKLPGLDKLAPDVLTHMEPFDPGQKYSVPYMQGTIGIGYNLDAVAKRLPGVKVDSWAVVFDPANLAKLKDCGVYFLDARRTCTRSPELPGQGPELARPGRLRRRHGAADEGAALCAQVPLLRVHRRAGQRRYLRGHRLFRRRLQAKARAEEAKNKVRIAYAIPKEGSQVWFDLFTIPKDAPNPAAAHKFIAFMLRPESSPRRPTSPSTPTPMRPRRRWSRRPSATTLTPTRRRSSPSGSSSPPPRTRPCCAT
jgi:putrescine transport system substrate-binding protein